MDVIFPYAHTLEKHFSTEKLKKHVLFLCENRYIGVPTDPAGGVECWLSIKFSLVCKNPVFSYTRASCRVRELQEAQPRNRYLKSRFR